MARRKLLPRKSTRSKYNYGKIFKKNGKWWRYRYEGRKKSTKTLTKYTRKKDR